MMELLSEGHRRSRTKGEGLRGEQKIASTVPCGSSCGFKVTGAGKMGLFLGNEVVRHPDYGTFLGGRKIRPNRSVGLSSTVLKISAADLHVSFLGDESIMRNT